MAISTSLVLKFDGAAVQRGLASIKKSFAKVGDAIKKIGIGIGAFAVGAAAGLVAAAIKINAIGEASVTSESRVKSIVKQMGLFGDESDNVAKRLIDFSKVTARQIGIDEKTIELTQAKLSTFKELALSADTAGGAFDRATMAALDLAANGMGTAEGNAIQLGKALNDPIKGLTSLSKSGVSFTVQEKAKIAALVQSNQMFKAQDVILKAIEAQVGKTALATADASQQIKVSFGQIVEAFAMPFSKGFGELPGMLESVFPLLKAKAEEAGGFVSSAISEAIAKDTTKLEALGVLIAEVIGTAMTSTFEIISAKMLSGISKLLLGEVGGYMMGGKRQEIDEFKDLFDQMARDKISGSIKLGTSEAMERYRQTIGTQSTLGREREQQAQVSAMQQAGKTFAAAGMPQSQRTPGTSPDILSAISSIPDMVRQTIVELKNVNRSLAPTP